MKKRKNYKAIAEEMSRCLVFALNHYKYTGGLVKPDGKNYITPLWWFANTLSLVGIEYDKDDIQALHGSAKARREYFKEKRKRTKDTGQ